jgi:hypothetical protein
MARGEITGRKPTPTAGRAKRGHNRGPPLDAPEPKYKRKPPSVDPNALALSIRAFCVLHDLSEDMFFKMQRDGWGPRAMKVGSRTLISSEAAAEWRRSREEAAAKQADATAP